MLILSDEIYEHILFDGRRFTSFGQACPRLSDRSLIMNGMSKTYSMTGWRVGYAAGPAWLIAAMCTIQSQSCTSVCSIAQAASVAALNGSQDHVRDFRAAFERRRDLVVQRIGDIPALTLSPPSGAFYGFIGCARLIGARTASGTTLTDDFGYRSLPAGGRPCFRRPRSRLRPLAIRANLDRHVGNCVDRGGQPNRNGCGAAAAP